MNEVRYLIRVMDFHGPIELQYEKLNEIREWLIPYDDMHYWSWKLIDGESRYYFMEIIDEELAIAFKLKFGI